MQRECIRTRNLFDLSHTRLGWYLSAFEYPWEALSGLGAAIIKEGNALDPSVYRAAGENIWIARSAIISPTAVIAGPCIIGENTQLRPGAYIRGSVIIGDSAVIGNSCEVKNSIIFDRAEVPHFNYVGDSILGYRAHLGAGAITSNLKSDRGNVVVHGEAEHPTGLRKLGAMVGDTAEVGAGCVLNPGVIIGNGSRVYPLTSVRGVVPEGCVLKGERGVFPLYGI